MATMGYSQGPSPPTDRGIVNSNQSIHCEAKKDFEKQIVLGDAPHGSSTRLGAKPLILRASDVLLSLSGRSADDAQDPSPGVENFQEALRLFPPFRDDDGATLGAVEVKCPDCDAVYSSQNELKQHYLTRFCPGAAVAVYVMTRDRLITKGYRMEKRLVSFDCRPIRFFCGHCDRHFAIGPEDEQIERPRDMPSFVDCKNCGEKCNISYEPILNDPRDDTSFRETTASAARSRSPSIGQKGSLGSRISTTASPNAEQSLAKRARRIRDSWSFRKTSQSDEDELVAISFAGLYDLERIHAPHGIYQQFEASGLGAHVLQSNASFTSSVPHDLMVADHKKGMCEEHEHHRKHLANGGDEYLENEAARDPHLSSRKQTLLQRIFGRMSPKGISRSRSTSNRGKRLIKRANTIRFSLVGRYPKNEDRLHTFESVRNSVDSQPLQAADRQSATPSPISDAEYIALLRGSQSIIIHLQHLPGGVVVHDVSGRQRILSIDEVALLFLRVKDELAAANIHSRVLTTRLRADSALKSGNARGAVVEYHDALRLLDNAPALDVDRLTRAAILHSLGQAYRNLDMPAESEACYLEALGLYKRTLGRDHPKNFAVLHDLGALCERDGYATEASALYERSFAGRLKTLGHNAPETLSSMQDLASLKVLLGDLESALLLLEQAVPALDTVFGLQNATTLNAMNQLSLLYQKLGFDKESRTICGRTIPHCRTFFGITSPITRDAVVRYLQTSENFDFPAEIKDILEHYQRSQDPDALRVIHRLGRSYMDAGLNRDASELFETLVEDFLVVKGPEAPETFDALSALCVSREHLDSIDKALLAYKQLVHMANRTPEKHQSRTRIGYAEKRIAALNRRRELLAAERKEWGLHEPGRCEYCPNSTAVLCNTCKIFRFCSDQCHTNGLAAHLPHCIPSVSLRESKSLAVKPNCPTAARQQAISKIRHLDSSRAINITASYTFYLDPRSFTTFRMKLNSDTNTLILFSLDSDIQYAIIDNPASASSSNQPPSPSTAAAIASATATSSTTTSTSDSTTSTATIPWLTPDRQETITYVPVPSANPLSPIPSPLPSPHYPKPRPSAPAQPPATGARYMLVTPGKEMFRAAIEKRIGVRAGDGEKERFRALQGPDTELIEYAQGLGLLLPGYLGEAFMYVIEWVWK
ncbi:hypothetical protein BDW42DRAFT_64314 [Aspergillus taichungensis]|uniref:MYND-type zinc finger protein samB n=1 Tax=Aspergillus taichungensis TaxID=482145 RepID=A0A2J5I183_9EURO|nr:hypothetical protein BDW42DRAFT_64314 [Aspergillus taichungensis]